MTLFVIDTSESAPSAEVFSEAWITESKIIKRSTRCRIFIHSFAKPKLAKFGNLS